MDMTPCGYQFGITCCLHFHLHRRRRHCVLRNVIFPPDYTVSHPTRQRSSWSPPWYPDIRLLGSCRPGWPF